MKKLRVTVAGKVYEVIVEVLEEDEHGPAHTAKHTTASSIHELTAPAAPSLVHAVSKEPGNVASPLAGRVLAIPVQAGQTVREGDQLMVLEAMKMNNYIYAPRSGKISAILVRAGDVVEEGQALFTIL
ncbi:MAG: biotin/lipoyl-binding protein [Planctomycetes bacterium]|nr:biotin/lipoyl-binding protein [Planctomycetota bacterium]